MRWQLILWVLLAAGSARALPDDRFLGGPHDGYSRSGLERFAPSASPRFSGGAHDGYARHRFLRYDGATSPQQVAPRFHGGRRDGYAGVDFRRYDAASSPQGVGPRFRGGVRDGYAVDAFHRYAAATSPQFTGPRFRGGAHDGADREGIAGLASPLRLDTDGDGLVDGWETRYFSSLLPLHGAGDYDQDGDDDARELIADTDPTDSNAYFRVTGIRTSSSVTITFVATNSRLYSLEGSTNLALATSWADVPGHAPLPGPPEGVAAVTITGAAPFEAYRVRVTLP